MHACMKARGQCQALFLGPSLTARAGQLVSELWELTYLHSHSPGITSVYHRPVSSTQVLGVRLRSSFFQSNHLTYGVISPCPRQISVYPGQCLRKSQSQAHRLRLVIRLNYSATSVFSSCKWVYNRYSLVMRSCTEHTVHSIQSIQMSVGKATSLTSQQLYAQHLQSFCSGFFAFVSSEKDGMHMAFTYVCRVSHSPSPVPSLDLTH